MKNFDVSSGDEKNTEAGSENHDHKYVIQEVNMNKNVDNDASLLGATIECKYLVLTEDLKQMMQWTGEKFEFKDGCFESTHWIVEPITAKNLHLPDYVNQGYCPECFSRPDVDFVIADDNRSNLLWCAFLGLIQRKKPVLKPPAGTFQSYDVREWLRNLTPCDGSEAFNLAAYARRRVDKLIATEVSKGFQQELGEEIWMNRWQLSAFSHIIDAERQLARFRAAESYKLEMTFHVQDVEYMCRWAVGPGDEAYQMIIEHNGSIQSQKLWRSVARKLFEKEYAHGCEEIKSKDGNITLPVSYFVSHIRGWKSIQIAWQIETGCGQPIPKVCDERALISIVSDSWAYTENDFPSGLCESDIRYLVEYNGHTVKPIGLMIHDYVAERNKRYVLTDKGHRLANGLRGVRLMDLQYNSYINKEIVRIALGQSKDPEPLITEVQEDVGAFIERLKALRQ